MTVENASPFLTLWNVLPSKNNNKKTENVLEKPKGNVTKASKGDGVLKPVPTLTTKEKKPSTIDTKVDTKKVASAAENETKQKEEAEEASMFIRAPSPDLPFFKATVPSMNYEDLDLDDALDPVMVAEYVEDCIAYMRVIEVKVFSSR